MFIALRIIHIVTGVFWAGTMFFMVSYLMPAFRDAGPDGAKVFAALRARRMFERVPATALLTVLSGLWLFKIRMGGSADWMRMREAQTLSLGALAAVLALLIGWFGMRASALKADDIAKAVGPMAAGPDRDARMGDAMKLRVRATMAGRAVATLLGVTVVCMAIARYI